MLIVVDLGIPPPNLNIKKKYSFLIIMTKNKTTRENVLFFQIDKNLIENNNQVNNY